MKLLYSNINNGEYDISCKLYFPSENCIKGVILGVHGFAGDKESSALKKLAYAVEQYGIALICFDLPAHGESCVNESSFTVKNCIRDLGCIADKIRNEYPNVDKYIFATSYGGFIALQCVEQLKEFKYVLRAPAVTMPEHILTDVIKLSAEEFKTAGSVECGLERSLVLPYSFYEELQHYSILGKNFDKPMLVIHGNADDVVPYEDILKFCRDNMSAELAVIDGADHRFKKPGEIESVIKSTIRYML